MHSLNDIRQRISEVKLMMVQTSDPQEKSTLAALGLEINAMFLQACGLLNIPPGYRESFREQDNNPYLPIDQADEKVMRPLKFIKSQVIKRAKVINLRRKMNGKKYVK